MWNSFLLDLLGYVAVVTLVAVTLAVLWTALSTYFRALKLSRDRPPSQAELADVAKLRVPGPMHLGGRDSAVARHFETTVRQNPLSRFGGGETVNSPHFSGIERSWREKRTGTEDP